MVFGSLIFKLDQTRLDFIPEDLDTDLDKHLDLVNGILAASRSCIGSFYKNVFV